MSWRLMRHGAVGALSLLVFRQAANAQTCDGVVFTGPLDGRIAAQKLVVFDPDGDGPQSPNLYAVSGSIFVWRNPGWERLRPSPDPFANFSIATVFDEDGPGGQQPALFVGGVGQSRSLVMRFDGATWTDISPPNDVQPVTAMCGHDPDGPGPQPARLVIAHYLNSGLGSGLAERTSSWAELNVTTPGVFNVLFSFDPDGDGPTVPWLIIAGKFDSIGTTSYSNIVRRVGTTLQRMGSGLGGGIQGVRALGTFDSDGDGSAAPTLFATGDFTVANHIARWMGTFWQSITSDPVDGVGCAMLSVPGFNGAVSPSLLLGGAYVLPPDSFATRELLSWSDDVLAPIMNGVSDYGAKVSDLTMYDLDGDGPASPALVLARSTGLWYLPMESSTPFPLVPSPIGTPYKAIPYDADGAGPAAERLVCQGPIVATNQTGTVEMDGSGWGELVSASWGGDWAVTDDGSNQPGAQRLYAASRDDQAFLTPGFVGVHEWTGSAWVPVPEIGSTLGVCSYDADGDGPLPQRLLAVEEISRRTGTSGVGSSRVRVMQYDGQAWSSLSENSGEYSQSFVPIASFDRDPTDNEPPQVVINFAGSFFRIENHAWIPMAGQPITDGWAVFDPDGPGGQPASLWYPGGYLGYPSPGSYSRYDGFSVTTFPIGFAGYPHSHPQSFCVLDSDGPGPAPARLYMLEAGDSVFLCRLNGASWNILRFPDLFLANPFVASAQRPLSTFAYGPNGRRLLAVSGGSSSQGGLVRGPIVLIDPAILPDVDVSPANPHFGRGRLIRLALVPPAAGTGASVQWFRNGVALSNDSRISGALSDQLSIAGAVASDAASYAVRVSLPCGSVESSSVSVAVTCAADIDGSGTVSVQDIFTFLALFFLPDPSADFNESGQVSVQDIFDFLAAYFTPCAG